MNGPKLLLAYVAMREARARVGSRRRVTVARCGVVWRRRVMAGGRMRVFHRESLAGFLPVIQGVMAWSADLFLAPSRRTESSVGPCEL